MLLKSITIENFGPYRHKNTIDFSIKDQNQNVILIGGENGAGKTTLLNSIKIALFGPYAYGLKTESSQYLKEIYDYLNIQAVKNEENNFQLTLEFSEVEDLVKTNYKFIRSWNFKNSNLKEELKIYKNNSALSEAEKEIYQSKLKDSMPPQLFDLCLFDGEEISRIINDNLLSTYLQRLSKVVFNLKLFENLEIDLDTFSKRKMKDQSDLKLEQDIDDLEDKLKIKKSSKIEVENNYNEKIEKIESLKSDLDVLRKDFETHGGLYKEERDKLLSQLNEIENTRKELNNQIKHYIGVILPFYLNNDLLTETVNQLESENSQQIFNEFSDNLTNETLSKILSDLGVPKKEQKETPFKNSLLKHMKPEDDLILHRASNDQKSKVIQMKNLVDENTSKHYDELLSKNKSLLEKAQIIRKKINKHDETNEFTNMIQKMEQIKVKEESIESETVELAEQIKLLANEITDLENKLGEKQKERYKDRKQKNALSFLQSLIDTSKEFRKIQQQKKLQEVENESVRMLKKLMRKDQYISNISIVSDSFEIKLFDKNQSQLNMETLSAGEKEILLLSLIWAIFKASGRRVPFIFDTLLGRLDKTHKSTVLKELIPSSSEQTLVLSTDTEIDEYHYNIIKPHLSHVYTLEFDNNTHNVNINPNYFFKEKMRWSNEFSTKNVK